MSEFKEVQWFNQWFMLITLMVPVGIGLYCIYAWYIAGIGVDKVSVEDTSGQLLVLGLLAFTTLFMLSMRLYTKVNEQGVHFKFLPFIWNWRKYSWYDIEICEIRSFDPLSDFGGWGLKKSLKGQPAQWSYTVKGNEGVFLGLKNGKTLIIGTQKSKEAQSFIQKFKKTKSYEN